MQQDFLWRRSTHARRRNETPTSRSNAGAKKLCMNRIATNGHAYYAVTQTVDAAYKELLARIGLEADIAFDFLSFPLPQPQ